MAEDYDPILAQVIARRLEGICREAAITLNRTSGSPIVTEVNDFSNSLMAASGETVAFSGYLPFEVAAGMNAMRDLLRSISLDDVQPGDHFAANDPYTSAPLHSADVNVDTPIFWRGELVAWAHSNVHMFDIGALTPGGWIPGALDRYSEGIHFPVIKIVHAGKWDEVFERMFLAAVRLPASLNDIRSAVAANNTAQERLTELLDRYGVETFRRYCEVNIRLSEEVARQRIAMLPDGAYEGIDWVEYDGQGVDGLYRLSVKMVVRGDELLIDLTDAPPQIIGFVNTTRSGVLGWILSHLIMTLLPDIPINIGVAKPLRVIMSPPGTMLNPSRDAATSGGHMESGTKVLRAFHQALHKAIGLSNLPELTGRAAALGGVVAPHNVVAGIRRDGSPQMWVSLDSVGTGLGAQCNIDGRDAGCYEPLTKCSLLDTELEDSYSALHLYRRLLPDSGGAGFRRGGLAIDTAWYLDEMDEARVTMLSNMTRIPTTGPGGGYPGGATANLIYRGQEPSARVSKDKRMPTPEELTSRPEIPPSHGTNIPVSTRDIFRSFCAGGCGLGDPLFRETWRVSQDVRDGLVTPGAAERVYGVVLRADGQVDEEATVTRRKQIRAERLGRDPEREPEPMVEYRPALKIEDKADGQWFACNHCGKEICPTSANWKEQVAYRSWPLVERAQYLGIYVRPRRDPEMWFWEFCCSACGTLLETSIYEESEKPSHDIQLGEITAGPGEAF